MAAREQTLELGADADARQGCLVCGAPGAALAFDAAGRCTHASGGALELLRLGRDAVIGSEADELGVALPANTDTGPARGGWEITRLGRDTVLAAWRGAPESADGDLAHAVVERQRAEAAALEARRRASELDAVIDAAADGLVVYDAGGGIQRMNRAAARMLGYDDETRAMPLGERLDVSRMSRRDGTRLLPEETPMARALRGEAVRSVVVQVRPTTRPGARLWLSVSAAPVRTPDGPVTGAVATFGDVTLLHALREQHEDMLRMISHDLRTPLGAVVLRAELLQRAGEGDAVRKHAAAIVDNAHRMSTMIEDLAELARIESGAVALRPRPVDVGVLLHELVERLAVALPMSRVVVQVAPGLPRVLADRERLERALVNLVTNALKYSSADVALVARRLGGRLALAVIDRGQGIAPEDTSRVFERYYRTKSARGTKGLGLGLYIASELVAAHGGEIRVDSRVGRGTTFTILLPLGGDPAARARSPGGG